MNRDISCLILKQSISQSLKHGSSSKAFSHCQFFQSSRYYIYYKIKYCLMMVRSIEALIIGAAAAERHKIKKVMNGYARITFALISAASTFFNCYVFNTFYACVSYSYSPALPRLRIEISIPPTCRQYVWIDPI